MNDESLGEEKENNMRKKRGRGSKGKGGKRKSDRDEKLKNADAPSVLLL